MNCIAGAEICAILALLFFSSASSSFCALICSLIFKKHRELFGSHRFVLFCLLSSVGILFLAAMFVFTPFLEFFLQLTLQRVLFYLIVSSVLFISVFFYKKIIPIVIALYFFYAGVSYFYLYLKYEPLPDEFFYEVVDSQSILTFEYYETPVFCLLPFSRFWLFTKKKSADFSFLEKYLPCVRFAEKRTISIFVKNALSSASEWKIKLFVKNGCIKSEATKIL